MSVELTGRDLDAAVAREIMGLRKVHTAFDLGEPVTGELYHYTADGDIPIVPAYSTDLNACRVAELEIERRGLEDDYLRELRREINDMRSDGDVRQPWYILVASAETRCRAMLKAARGAKKP